MRREFMLYYFEVALVSEPLLERIHCESLKQMHGTDLVFWTMRKSYKFIMIKTLKIASVTTLEFHRTMSGKYPKTLKLNNKLLSNTSFKK